jgi:hypothetical protein
LTKDGRDKDEDLTYGELQQSLIDTYHDGHFKTIYYTDKLLKKYQKEFDELENPKLKKKYQTMIRGG